MERDDREIKRILADMKEDEQTCPDFIELAEFMDGAMGSADSEKIRTHLANCESCLEKLRIGLILSDEFSGKVPEKVLNPAKSLFKPALIQRVRGFLRKIFQTGASTEERIPEPAFAFRGVSPARASSGLSRYFQEFGPYRAEVEVEQVEGNRWQIGVFVEEKEVHKPARDMRVSINDCRQMLESLVLENGRAVFEPVFKGSYQIGFHSRGRFLRGLLINLKGEEK